ncbi:NAD(P)H-dependent oxidoreductase [Enterobacteriaceae bacterium ESL0689]|nr:NAD(P)H-dependent oxidoreductase [Enterobacteriaceae bacterium ESL0689]
MKKSLIIVAHPSIQTSVINRRWLEEVKKYPELFTIHELYPSYPDWHIDIAKEQKIIEDHAGIIFQFPLYWFNCPPLLKKWFDDVFTYGWAYGSTATQLQGRKMGLAVSAGGSEKDFSQAGRCGFTLPDILRPFEMVAKYIRADYQPLFYFNGAISDPGVAPQYTLADLEISAKNYIDHIKRLA